jgi:predicted Zn-dependent protease with MMP-like domain
MEKKKFEGLVEDALDKLPEEFKELIDNVTVIVEDRPSREVYKRTGSPPFSYIFGLYHGVPYKHRGPFYGNLPPDVIVIYQEPIERYCSSEVVKHEIGHYFGMKDPELKEIERSKQARKK